MAGVPFTVPNAINKIPLQTRDSINSKIIITILNSTTLIL